MKRALIGILIGLSSGLVISIIFSLYLLTVSITLFHLDPLLVIITSVIAELQLSCSPHLYGLALE